MIPIFWRYLLRSYLQAFCLSVVGFIAILLVTRFQEIARFAALGATKKAVALFSLYQIPYILPLAIPISCMIAAILLFQRLSQLHELTALRASGLSLKAISYPIFFAAGALSLLNFFIVSEIAPICRAHSKNLVYQITATNPLFLLQRDPLIKIRNSYTDMKRLQAGKKADDVLFVILNAGHKRLNVMTAKELAVKDNLLTGKEVSFISNVEAKNTLNFDHLIIENQRSMSTEASTLSQFLQDVEWHHNPDYLPSRLLLLKERAEQKQLGSLHATHLEIARRFSLAIAAISFTLIGTAFGMQIGRNRNKRGVVYAICLSAFFLICFLVAKSTRHSVFIPVLFYLLPHPIIVLFSYLFMRKIQEGKE